MTTIAWDGKTLAADRQITFGTITDASHRKIHKRESDGALVAAAGTTGLGTAFIRWFLAGENGDHPPLSKGAESANGFVIRPDGKLEFYDETGWFEFETKNFTMGSGGMLALGAMDTGLSAKEAVKLAAKRDGSTGTKIDTLEPGK